MRCLKSMLKNSENKYGLITKTIHWVTALLILMLLCMGFKMTSLPFGEDKLWVYMLHKSLGLTVLLLAFVRVAWHVISKRPSDLPTHATWEKKLAHVVHFLIYVALFAMPLSGWIMSSAGDFTVQFFGINMPDIAPKNEKLFDATLWFHQTMALVIIAVVALHAAGALKHHFIDRDITLKRMTHDKVGFVGAGIIVLIAAIFMVPTLIMAAQQLMDQKPQAQEEAASEQTQGAAETLQQNGWSIDHEKSRITFTATQYGQDFEGHFEGFDGQIIFDPATPDQNKAKIEIKIASIKTGSEDRDTQARSAEWFGIDQYPVAIYETQSITKTDETHFFAKGMLNLHGVTIPVEFPFTLAINGNRAVMAAELILKRLDFGIGQGEWQKTDAVGNDVKVSIAVEAIR